MTKRFLLGGLIFASTLPLTSVFAADITYSVVNEVSSGATYSADLLVQHSDGTAELIPFVTTATGQYSMNISAAGSPYTPTGQASFSFWGPGAGSGNVYSGSGGGGSGGQIIQSFGGASLLGASESSDAEVQGLPVIVITFVGSCLSGRVMAAAHAEFHCRNNGGVRDFSSGFCGYPLSAECEGVKEPPEPLPEEPGSGQGGGGSTLPPPRMIFIGVDTTLPEGSVTIGEITQE